MLQQICRGGSTHHERHTRKCSGFGEDKVPMMSGIRSCCSGFGEGEVPLISVSALSARLMCRSEDLNDMDFAPRRARSSGER